MEDDYDITDIRSFPLFPEQTERASALARRTPQPDIAAEHAKVIVLRTAHPKSNASSDKSSKSSDASSDTSSIKSDSR